MKFIMKPVIIEANHFDGTYSCMEQLQAIYGDMQTSSVSYHKDCNIVTHWEIRTLKGGNEVRKGDWIIKGVDGEYYVIRNEIFIKTYEPA